MPIYRYETSIHQKRSSSQNNDGSRWFCTKESSQFYLREKSLHQLFKISDFKMSKEFCSSIRKENLLRENIIQVFWTNWTKKFVEKRPVLAKKKIFYQDNAPVHKNVLVIGKLKDLKCCNELLKRPFYSQIQPLLSLVSKI